MILNSHPFSEGYPTYIWSSLTSEGKWLHLIFFVGVFIRGLNTNACHTTKISCFFSHCRTVFFHFTVICYFVLFCRIKFHVTPWKVSVVLWVNSKGVNTCTRHCHFKWKLFALQLLQRLFLFTVLGRSNKFHVTIMIFFRSCSVNNFPPYAQSQMRGHKHCV